MIDRACGDLSIARQCRLLGISRSTFYATPCGESPENLALMRRIDELFLECPFFGSRQMVRALQREGRSIGRHRVRRLMQLMGLRTVYQKPRTSDPHPEHRIYPYLLRALEINRANQVWCADITYIPMHKGFLYLVAIMDWHTRRVLSWELSNTMDADFCVNALKQALALHGTPEIFNTDQGSQFTSSDFTSLLNEHKIKISMDGKGRWMDNVFIERLWRSMKYESVYLYAFETGSAVKAGIGRWIAFYNHRRPHSAHGIRTPDEAYAQSLALQHRSKNVEESYAAAA
jgi:putative transposase